MGSRYCALVIAFVLGTCAPAMAQSKLALTEPALRALRLNYITSHQQEFGACGIGRIAGDTVIIERVVPADVEIAHDRTMDPVEPCTETWGSYFGTLVVAAIHSHPGPDTKCSHFLFLENGAATKVPTSDWWRFKSYSKEQVSIIWCGNRVAWLNRAGDEYTALITPSDTLGPTRQARLYSGAL